MSEAAAVNAHRACAEQQEEQKNGPMALRDTQEHQEVSVHTTLAIPPYEVLLMEIPSRCKSQPAQSPR